MKILYASCRYDPLDRDAGSGVDFNIHEALQKSSAKVRIVGPFKDTPSRTEQVYRRIHHLLSRKLHAKFSTAYLKDCAKKVTTAIQEFEPDAIFTHNLIPLVYLETDVPIIYKSDAVLWNMHPQWPTYSRIELWRMLNWERNVLHKATRIITASRWAQTALVDHYRIPPEHILILPIPSSLPIQLVPPKEVTPSLKRSDVRLLAVAKDFHLKGIDIAIETTRQLREAGIQAHLRVAGQNGENTTEVEFLVLFQKKEQSQMQAYLEQYQWAHFLIHPARYEAAGIVCGEAAAFGVPTVTNGIGGLGTTVENGVSGVVLPMLSPASEYTLVISHYVNNPEAYATLRKSTRRRYEDELNWDAAGTKIMAVIRDAIADRAQRRSG